jgi:hypothetical protein
MNATSSPALDLDVLADRIATTAASLDAATHGLLTDVRAFDERGGWAAQGALSCARWLSFRCGIGAFSATLVSSRSSRTAPASRSWSAASFAFSQARCAARSSPGTATPAGSPAA